MCAMNRSSRASNVFFTFLGAASVGLVVAVLALAGVFKSERVVREVPSPTTTAVADAPARPAGSVSEIYAKAAPGVAFIAAEDGSGGGGTGSGFLMDGQGHVVTNDHVVEAADKYTIRFGEDGDPLPAKLIGTDRSTDLAVLEVDPKKIPAETKPLQLSSSADLRPGDTAIAIGSPFGLSGTVTTGIISALDREIQSPNGFPISGVLQTDAAINPGNSGGPLLDARGRVIGVNSQIETGGSTTANTGVGFAVPVDAIKRALPYLQEGKDVPHAFLGVRSSLAPEGGAGVETVVGAGPAARAGLRAGDRIVEIAGSPVRDPDDVSAAVNSRRPGDEVRIVVERGGERRTLTVKLGEQPDQASSNP
jgi:S1-C subfamily serine protease